VAAGTNSPGGRPCSGFCRFAGIHREHDLRTGAAGASSGARFLGLRVGIGSAADTAWSSRRRRTNRETPRKGSCSRWCATTSRHSARGRPLCATAPACRVSWNKPPSRPSAPACHAEAKAEAGVPRLPGLWLTGGRLRAVPLRRVRTGSVRAVFVLCRAVCQSCGPSALREPQGRRELSRTAASLRTIPSLVEGWPSCSDSDGR